MVGIYHINFIFIYNLHICHQVDHHSKLNYRGYLDKIFQNFNYLYFNFSIFMVNSTNVFRKV